VALSCMTQDVVLRKYPQRRLYDASRRKFLTLSDIAELVKAGAAVSARDGLDRDITNDVLCQVILKQEAESISGASPLSSELLRQLIRLGQQPSQPALPLYLDHLSKLLESVPTGAVEPPAAARRNSTVTRGAAVIARRRHRKRSRAQLCRPPFVAAEGISAARGRSCVC